MARKANRTWFSDKATVVISSAGGPVARSPIISFPEGSVQEGTLWVNRLFGVYGVRLVSIVAGAENRIVPWVGVCNTDSELPITGMSITNNDDDNINWLWREAVDCFPCGRHAGAGTDYTVTRRFDWALRQGHGSQIRDGQSVYLVAGADADTYTGVTSIFVTWSYLTLYSGV